MLILLSTALTLLLAGTPADNDKDNAMTLMDFSPRDLTAWNAVNDGVMGGLSRSYLRRTHQETAVFGGTVSLENNGGFASVRSRVPASDLSAFTGLAVRVRGDGRTYQLRLRSDDRFDGIAYRAVFATEAGRWTTIHLPFDTFQPVFRGRIIADAAPLDLARIRQVGFLIADKEAGPFALEIDAVEAVREQAVAR